MIERRDYDDFLCELYTKQETTVDYLPYTNDFEGIYLEFVNGTRREWTRHGVWQSLMRLRKQMKLPRKSKREVKNKKTPAREAPKPLGKGFYP